jgi:hypothetical protein
MSLIEKSSELAKRDEFEKSDVLLEDDLLIK